MNLFLRSTEFDWEEREEIFLAQNVIPLAWGNVVRESDTERAESIAADLQRHIVLVTDKAVSGNSAKLCLDAAGHVVDTKMFRVLGIEDGAMCPGVDQRLGSDRKFVASKSDGNDGLVKAFDLRIFEFHPRAGPMKLRNTFGILIMNG